MARAAAFSATYADWKLIKTRSVVQVVLEIPLDQSDLAYQVLGGMPDPGAERWCAVARLEGRPVPGGPLEAAGPAQSDDCGERDRPHKPRKPVAAEKRLAQQAGILCADPVFQAFIGEMFLDCARTDEDGATLVVYRRCGVVTRRDLIPGTPEGDRWIDLHGQFEAWKLAS